MFQLVDCFFFVSLGITFLLLFFMAFHFKTRISTLEKKNNALADMCTTIVAKISQVKQMVVAQNTYSPPPAPPMEEMHMHSMIPNVFFRSPDYNNSVEIIEIAESESDSDDDDDDENDDDENDHDDDVDENENEKEKDIDNESLEEEIKLDELKVEEPIHLETTSEVLDVLEVVVPDADLQSEVFSLAIHNDDKNSYKKMSVQMLRTLVISKGLSADPSKMKKLDLLKMLSDSESEIS